MSPVIFSLYVCMYVKDMPIPSRPVELPVYANDMAVRATSRHVTLLFRYLEIYPNMYVCM